MSVIHKIVSRGVLLFLTLFCASAGAAEPLSEAQQVDKLVQLLSQEEVERNSPDSLVRAAQQSPHFLGLAGSEAGEDHFFQAYEKKLRPATDKRFPQAAQVRSQLVDVFNLVNDFLQDVFGSGSVFGHHHNRIPGYVEWYLYSGYESNFSRPFDTRYGLDNIRIIGEVIVRANWEARATEIWEGPRDVAAALGIFLPRLERALVKLGAVEEKLPEAGRYYFRQQIVRELAWFLCIPNMRLQDDGRGSCADCGRGRA
jgi:hypothetical protein